MQLCNQRTKYTLSKEYTQSTPWMDFGTTLSTIDICFRDTGIKSRMSVCAYL